MEKREVTDTATQAAPAPQQAVVDLASLQSLAQQIQQVDEKLAAAQGNEAAMKQSVVDRHISENQAAVDQVLGVLLPQIENELPPPVRVAVYFALPKALEEALAGPIDELINAQVAEMAKGVKENVDPLKLQRKELVDTFKAMEAILSHLKIDTSSVPLPRRSGGRPSGSGGGGGSAKSGKNRENKRYIVNGNPMAVSQNSISSTAWYSSMGCVPGPPPDRWTTAQFKEFLTSQGINFAPGGDETWKVTLPNGKVVEARPLDPELDKDIFEANDDSNDADDDNGDSTPAPPAETATGAPATA
jgi:hypothetical protein